MNILRLVVLVLSFMAIEFGFWEALSAARATEQALQEGENIHFRWAFVARVRTADGQELFPVTGDTMLKTGDQFKIFLEVMKKCFVYVIYHGAQSELRLLYPGDLTELSTGKQPSKQYCLPEGLGWFELDDQVGRETFYLLASAQRLIELETLIKDYEHAEPARKPELAAQILDEIRKVRWRHRKFKTSAERPAEIVGRVRAADETKESLFPNLTNYAIEISAKDFYSRTFRVEHR